MDRLLIFFFLLVPHLILAQADSLGVMDSLAFSESKVDTVGIIYIDGDSVFSLYQGSGDLSVNERAEWITNKLAQYTAEINLQQDSLYLDRQDDKVWLYINGNRIYSISDKEAEALGLEADVLAEKYRLLIINKLRNEVWWENLKVGALRALGAIAATLILLLIYRYLNRWYRKLFVFIRRKREYWCKGIHIKNTTLVSPDKQLELVHWLLRVIKWFIFIVIGYLYLPVIFSIFPWTRGLADKLFGYVLTPLSSVWKGFVDYLPNVFAIAVIIIVAYYINKFIKFLLTEIAVGNLEIKGFYKDWADTTYRLINICLVVFTMTVIWPYIPGSSSDAFKGISIFVGVLLSLGSTGAISNIVSGTVITYMRPFVKGDRVKIADTVGTVVEKTLLVTRIKTPKNVLITVPNSMILSSHIINYSNDVERQGIVLHTSITIGYDVPWQQVHDQLISAAKSVEDLQKKPEPFVLQKALNDFYVEYELNAYTKRPERMERIYSDLHQQIQDKFNEAGIEIMSPHYNALRDGNHSTIPKDHLGDDYSAPSFNVQRPDDNGR